MIFLIVLISVLLIFFIVKVIQVKVLLRSKKDRKINYGRGNITKIKLKDFLILFNVNPERWIYDSIYRNIYYRTDGSNSVYDIVIYGNILTEIIMYNKIKKYYNRKQQKLQKERELRAMSNIINVANKDAEKMEAEAKDKIAEAIALYEQISKNFGEQKERFKNEHKRKNV